ncbi:MAG: hypothetical protein FWD67_06765 [Betaproteobacteria bacterium]|nr:hypothetical protein [Betaproteobacteria bacterium]
MTCPPQCTKCSARMQRFIGFAKGCGWRLLCDGSGQRVFFKQGMPTIYTWLKGEGELVPMREARCHHG